MSTQKNRNQFRTPDNPDSNNATHFRADDAPEGSFISDYRKLNKKQHFKYLKEINSGKVTALNWYNDQVITYEMASDYIDILSAQLGLTPKERGQARGYFVNLDREKLGLESSLVAYCVCSYVVEENCKNTERRCHPNLSDEKMDPLFQEIVDSLNLDEKSVKSAYGKIESRLPDTAPSVQDENRNEHHLHGDDSI
ncbi:hypothetical protein B4589_012725 [Halolamina sp. CBA1230]|uniref:hypothetical protein n=1 Tax=Halolamina sp. CBA1230 TaxID=1853690 RepID=UPI00117A9B60|nr:hypothetical protein [Halolamina sp. CBA1230]QKY21195.1 hypothetical protein B4589_012725 [Halolamina sp. CBA1230]